MPAAGGKFLPNSRHTTGKGCFERFEMHLLTSCCVEKPCDTSLGTLSKLKQNSKNKFVKLIYFLTSNFCVFVLVVLAATQRSPGGSGATALKVVLLGSQRCDSL